MQPKTWKPTAASWARSGVARSGSWTSAPGAGPRIFDVEIVDVQNEGGADVRWTPATLIMHRPAEFIRSILRMLDAAYSLLREPTDDRNPYAVAAGIATSLVDGYSARAGGAGGAAIDLIAAIICGCGIMLGLLLGLLLGALVGPTFATAGPPGSSGPSHRRCRVGCPLPGVPGCLTR